VARKYKRVLLKVSGEALMGDKGYGIDAHTVDFMAKEIKDVLSMGVELAIVIGAAIYSGDCRPALRVWNGPPQITWAWSRR